MIKKKLHCNWDARNYGEASIQGPLVGPKYRGLAASSAPTCSQFPREILGWQKSRFQGSHTWMDC